MAADIPLPGSVYQDVLEEKFLLRAYAERWHAQTAGTIAPALSMASRNDLVAEAMQQLKPPHRQMFLDYLESLVAALPPGTDQAFPAFVVHRPPATTAELLATELLKAEHGSLWVAARQVISELQFRPVPRAFDAAQLCFKLGAYGHRSFVGLHQETKVHEATCVLLNAFVKLVRPSHCWSTLSINVDSRALPHRDPQNSGLSLVIGVSHFNGGSLWIEQAGGDCFEDIAGELVPGVCMPVSGQAVLFDARACLHSVREWSGGNRLTLIAYCIGQYNSLCCEHREQLLALGFQLPEGQSHTGCTCHILPSLVPGA